MSEQVSAPEASAHPSPPESSTGSRFAAEEWEDWMKWDSALDPLAAITSATTAGKDSSDQVGDASLLDHVGPPSPPPFAFVSGSIGIADPADVDVSMIGFEPTFQVSAAPVTATKKRKAEAQDPVLAAHKLPASRNTVQAKKTAPAAANGKSTAGAGGRQPRGQKISHNVIEKRYRSNLNDKIAKLRDSVPELRSAQPSIKRRPAPVPSTPTPSKKRKSDAGKGKDSESDGSGDEDGDGNADGGDNGGLKFNKATVLTKATEYIQQLERMNQRLQSEVSNLRHRLGSVNSARDNMQMYGYDSTVSTGLRVEQSGLPSPANTGSPHFASAPSPCPTTATATGTDSGSTSSGVEGLIKVPESMRRLRQEADNGSDAHYAARTASSSGPSSSGTTAEKLNSESGAAAAAAGSSAPSSAAEPGEKAGKAPPTILTGPASFAAHFSQVKGLIPVDDSWKAFRMEERKTASSEHYAPPSSSCPSSASAPSSRSRSYSRLSSLSHSVSAPTSTGPSSPSSPSSSSSSSPTAGTSKTSPVSELPTHTPSAGENQQHHGSISYTSPFDMYLDDNADEGQGSGWARSRAVSRILIGSLGALMIMEGFSEKEQLSSSSSGTGRSSSRGLFALPTELLTESRGFREPIRRRIVAFAASPQSHAAMPLLLLAGITMLVLVFIFVSFLAPQPPRSGKLLSAAVSAAVAAAAANGAVAGVSSSKGKGPSPSSAPPQDGVRSGSFDRSRPVPLSQNNAPTTTATANTAAAMASPAHGVPQRTRDISPNTSWTMIHPRWREWPLARQFERLGFVFALASGSHDEEEAVHITTTTSSSPRTTTSSLYSYSYSPLTVMADGYWGRVLGSLPRLLPWASAEDGGS